MDLTPNWESFETSLRIEKIKLVKVQRLSFPMPDILGYFQAFFVTHCTTESVVRALMFNQPCLILTSNAFCYMRLNGSQTLSH